MGNASFAKYSFPEKDEAFDEVKYEWQDAKKSADYLSQWRQEKKTTARIEDLIAGDWFEAQSKAWATFLQKCKQKQNDYKALVAKKKEEKDTKEKLKQQRIAQKEAKKRALKAAKERALKLAAAKKASEAAAKKAAKEKAAAEKQA